MSAGHRACYVEILKPDPVNTTGEPNPTPVLHKRIWVSLIPDRSREEQPRSAERIASVVYKMRADYYDSLDIDETMIVRYNGAEFGITGAMVDYVTRGDTTFEVRKQTRGA